MSEKDEPLAPRRTVEQYEADKAAGINPIGHAFDGITDQELKRPKKSAPEPKQEDVVDTLVMLNIATSRGLEVAAHKIFLKFHELWLVERFRLDNLVVQSAMNKTSPGDNYWEAEHRAHINAENAYKVWQAIKEANHASSVSGSEQGVHGNSDGGSEGSGSPSPESNPGMHSS
jgi:hypothetical protein